MPLIDGLRPMLDDGETGRGWPDRVIADFGMALRVAKDTRAEMMGEHLRAKTNAEKGLVLFQRHRDPPDLAADEIGVVVGAHGAAEDDRGGVLRHGLRQRIVEARAAHVERVTELAQRIADAARGGMLLVQDDQNWLEHDRGAGRVLRHSYSVCASTFEAKRMRAFIIGNSRACGK